MVERKIILPKNILEYYQTFHGIQDNYVTLMGCYPIGSDAKRIMVVAKEITENK